MSDEELNTLRERAARNGRKGSYGHDAIRLNQRILELDPSDATALLRLTRCHEESHDWLGALDCYEQLLALDIGDTTRIRAKIEATRGKAAGQIEARRQAEERERARVAREQEHRKEREKEAQAIDDFRAARTLAIQAREAEDFEAALIYHARSLELATSMGDTTGALAAKASTLRAAGRPADACAVLRQSIELDPSREQNKPSYTSLVAALRELGELDRARTEGEALLELYANDSYVLFALGRVLKAVAERDGNANVLERAHELYSRAEALKPEDRNITAELRSLISLYEDLAAQHRDPRLSLKARQLEHHLARLDRRVTRTGTNSA